ncbi:hypothetical protein K439DRAFT_1639408 [Ramaria rubella]|nr:hypothetical protein K439DRAFT_1639408 [Ramaria rubella]
MSVPSRVTELKASLAAVTSRISAAVESSVHPTLRPTLVAVSKYKPASDIAGLYDAGQRDFGENYVNEILEKAPVLPADIRWHFIGHLQSNKAKALAAVPNLHALHTLTSIKLATALNKARSPSDPRLQVLLQVNTSGEDSKSGLLPLYLADASPDPPSTSGDGLVALARHVITSCPQLHLVGLMTIGSLQNSIALDNQNQDFQTLIRTRAVLEEILKREFPIVGDSSLVWGDQRDGLTLSMGMSADFEPAIHAGSGIVRVGTAIFGDRQTKNAIDTNSTEVVEG